MYKAFTSKMSHILSYKYKNNIGRHKMKAYNNVFPEENAIRIHPEFCNCSNFHFYGTCKHCE